MQKPGVIENTTARDLDNDTPDTEREVTIKPHKSKKKSDIQDKFYKEKLKHLQQKRWFRWAMFGFFAFLLVFQYGLLAWLVSSSFSMIDRIQALLGVLVPATLTETCLILKVMVDSVFTEGDFETKKQNG